MPKPLGYIPLPANVVEQGQRPRLQHQARAERKLGPRSRMHGETSRGRPDRDRLRFRLSRRIAARSPRPPTRAADAGRRRLPPAQLRLCLADDPAGHLHRAADRRRGPSRRCGTTASVSSPAASGTPTPASTASPPKSGARSTPPCWRLVIGTAFGVAAALFLSEGYLGQSVFGILKAFGSHLHPVWGKLPDQVEDLLKNLIELLAAIPSVVYGLWGLFVVIPLIRPAVQLAASEDGLASLVRHGPERSGRAARGDRACPS